MNTSLGYSKQTLDDTNVLLSGGGSKSLGDFLGSIQWDSTNKKLQYKSASATNWTDLVSFGYMAFEGNNYLPLTGGTVTGTITFGTSTQGDFDALVPARNNYHCIGNDTHYWYEAYVTSYFGEELYVGYAEINTVIAEVVSAGSFEGPAEYLAGSIQVTDLNSTNLNKNRLYWHGGNVTGSPTGAAFGDLLQISNKNTPQNGTNDHWVHQLDFGHDGQLYFRNRINQGAWEDWKKIVYNSGTWNINVSGSAASLSGYAESSFFRYRNAIDTSYVDLTTYTAGATGYMNPNNGIYIVQRTGYSEGFMAFTGDGSASGLDILFTYGRGEDVKIRRRIDGNRLSGAWETILLNSHMGTGSGIDADMVDGLHASDLVKIASTTATSLTNLDTSKSFIYATLSSSVSASSFTLSGTMSVGQVLTVLVLNNGSTTINITIPSTWKTLDDYTLAVGANKFIEISILCYASNSYIVSSKGQ